MGQRTRADTKRDRETITDNEPRDSWKRRFKPTPGNGVCQFCDRLEVRGLTPMPSARNALLCFSCRSSSRIRSLIAAHGLDVAKTRKP